MHAELAFDAQGHPIRFPHEAAKLLVRRIRPKAPPQPIYRNGRRVVLPVHASLDDFRAVINDAPGRYRLLALDAQDEPLDGVPEAYVEIEPEPVQYSAAPEPAPAPAPGDSTRAALAHQPTELLLLETMRANTELAAAAINRIPEIMKAAAYLLTAADGAGLPRRPPVWIDDDDDDQDDEYEDQDDAPPAPSMIEQLMKALSAGGSNPLAGFANLLGAGAPPATTSAAAQAQATAPAASAPPAPPAHTRPTDAPHHGPAATGARNASPSTDPHAHLVAILTQLSAAERAYAERVMQQLTPDAIEAWHKLLLSMSVDEAVAMIRAKAQGQEA